MNKKFKISVIIPIYNVEDYIEETIQSIINQSIGFNNIQLILVNDGSTDNSEKICLKYKNEYPDNIDYISQKNQGVSAARNNGLKYAKGELINFFDSDDLWEREAYEKAINMFEKNKNISSVWFPMKFFDAKNSNHPLSYMYEQDKVINILENYQYIKLSSTSIILKKELLEGKEYDKKIHISEDVKLLTEILMDNPYVGLIHGVNYLYRKRKNESSTINNSIYKKTWYVDTPKLVYSYLIKLSKKKFKKVIPYIQWLILYDFQWRVFNTIPNKILTKKEENNYITILRTILKNIDPNIIEEVPYYDNNRKLNLINFINDGKLNITLKNDKSIVNKVNLNINKYKIKLSNKEIKNNKLIMYCIFPDVDELTNNLCVVNEKKEKFYFKKYELDKSNKYTKIIDKNNSINNTGLSIEIDLNKFKKLYFAIDSNDKLIKINFTFGGCFELYKSFASTYLKSDNYYIKYIKSQNELSIIPRNIKNKLILSSKLYFNLLKKRKIKNIVYRIVANIYSLFNHKKIWIVSDRIQYANDNGEAFFEYLMDKHKKDKQIKYYFTIKKNTKDYNRLKNKYGKNIIEYDSFKYKILFLNSDKIISAHADGYVVNPFGKSKKYMRDLYNFKYIFLQHGITKDDLSPWLNINNKTIDMFICAGTPEYNSIIKKYNYNFPKKVIQLTGFARFDKLKNNDTPLINSIMIAPTWRSKLAGEIDPKTGKRNKIKGFKETKYFKFYNDLLNNKRLLNCLKKNNYKIKFIPHANMVEYLNDFTFNELVDICKGTVFYSKEFKQNKLLVTDFSSTFFDFAYLHKPIIYSQFDPEDFYEGQIYDKGYFDYEKDGFGPVCSTLDDTVDKIIKLVEKDCLINKKYKERINNFFAFNDQNNCERIYNSIIKLDKE